MCYNTSFGRMCGWFVWVLWVWMSVLTVFLHFRNEQQEIFSSKKWIFMTDIKNCLPKMLLLRFLVLSSIVYLSSGWLSHQRQKQKQLPELNIGLITKHTNFGAREYTKAIKNAIFGLHKNKERNLDFLRWFNFTHHNVHLVLMHVTPTPTGTLNPLFYICAQALWRHGDVIRTCAFETWHLGNGKPLKRNLQFLLIINIKYV